MIKDLGLILIAASNRQVTPEGACSPGIWEVKQEVQNFLDYLESLESVWDT